jgi:Tat protein secretion system quality control protein TatD with DNase activity
MMSSTGCASWRETHAWWPSARSALIIITCPKGRTPSRPTRNDRPTSSARSSRSRRNDTLAILAAFTGRVRGVFHCFGGTLAQAKEAIALGHLVSFTGIVTFKNARQVQATAQDIDADHFMVETDCPYLAPAPDRGKRCEPAHTRRVADFIASLRGELVETLAARTTGTARDFFRFERATAHPSS